MPEQTSMESVRQPMQAGAEIISEQSHSTARPWLFPLLLLLGLLKLGVVGFIYVTTHAANKQRWNKRAVDYRYLAERLRAMHYLPQVGSFQPQQCRARCKHPENCIRVQWIGYSIQ